MITPNLKRIDLWPSNVKLMTIIVSILFLFILGYFFCLRQIFEKKEGVYLSLQSINKKLNRQLKMSEEYSSSLKKVKILKDILTMDLNDADGKRVLHIMNGKLFFKFLDLYEIYILTVEKKLFFSVFKVESKFHRMNSMIDFLNQVVSLKHFILVEDFRWKFLNDGSKKQNQDSIFLLKFYVPYIGNKRFSLIASTFNKFFINSTPGKNSLIKYALNDLKMCGFLSEGKDQRWGFVVLPDKKIYKIELGDYLGLERGLVVGIYAKKIFIQNNKLNKIIKLSIENDK